MADDSSQHKAQIKTILESVGKALGDNAARSRFVVLRCPDPTSVDTAVSMLQRAFPKVGWSPVDGAHMDAAQVVVAGMRALQSDPPRVPVLYSFPGESTGKVADKAQAESFGRLALERGLAHGPCILVLLTSSVRVLADAARELWKGKGAYLAWPSEVPIFQQERGAPASPTNPTAESGAVPDDEDIARVLSRVHGERAADYLMEVAKTHLKAGSVESARSFLIRAAQIYGENASLEGMARSYSQLASVAMGRGDTRAAVEWLEQAEDNYRVLDDLDGMSEVLAQRGHAEYLWGRLDRAAKAFKECLAVDTERKDSERISAGYRRIAMILERVKKWQSSEDLLKKSLAIEEQEGREVGTARVLIHLGRLALIQKNYSVAEETTQRALDILQGKKDRLAEAGAYHQLGNVHFARKRYDDAAGAYQQSISLETVHGDLMGLARTTAQMALVFAESGDRERSLHQYVKAHYYASKMRSPLAAELADKVAQLEPSFPPEAYNRTLLAATHEAESVARSRDSGEGKPAPSEPVEDDSEFVW
jgi:tetratricopeptide (TPR) repeat protein